MTDYEKIMAILNAERDEELMLANAAYKDMVNTKNPFKRYKLYKLKEMALKHAVGIDLAIGRVKREFDK